ncbi:hypothetical protein U1Q18_011120 [Sarracenia purpurea var. burkii]
MRATAGVVLDGTRRFYGDSEQVATVAEATRSGARSKRRYLADQRRRWFGGSFWSELWMSRRWARWARRCAEDDDGALEAPKAVVVEAPKAGLLDAPNAGVLDAPNAGVPEAPNVPPDPNTGALETPNVVPVLPNVGLAVEPKAGVLVNPKPPKTGFCPETF